MTTESQAPEAHTEDLPALVSAMRRGDPASSRAFIAYFLGPLYHYLYWLTGDPETASEIFQQTMMAVYRNLGRVRKAKSANTWVYRQATLFYLEQGRRQLQKKRSSWDNILKGGLEPSKDDRWSQWDDAPTDVHPQPPARLPYLVDALKHLTPRQRAAILLAALAEKPQREITECLQLSRRAAAKAQLSALGQLTTSLKAQPGRDSIDLPKGTRTLVRKRLLGMLSPGRARKLTMLLDSNEAAEAVHKEEEADWRIICELPSMPAPATLLDDTEAHLRAGQEAQEVRIANWSFRFMQVTVPVFILIFLTIILLPAISRSREAARRAAGEENLRAIGQALLSYSESAPGRNFPPMASATNWVPDLTMLYPRYIKDPALLVRPSLQDPELTAAMIAALTSSPPDYATAQDLFARSYLYTGYVLQDIDDMEAFISALQSIENLAFTNKIETPKKDFFRLSRGVEVFFTTKYNDPAAAAETRAAIPIMFETFDSPGFDQAPDGACVLYLDGHVDYVRFGESFPVLNGVRELLEER